MSRRLQLQVTALLLVLMVGAACLWSAPAGIQAQAQPLPVKPGQMLTITATVDDPAGEVASVKAAVVEAGGLQLPLTKGSDGVWKLSFPVPGDAAATTYHLDIIPFGKDGQPFLVNGTQLKATLAVEVKGDEAPPADLTQLQATAKPWRTETQLAKVPKRKAGEPFNFAVMGDSRSNPAIFAQALRIAAQLKFDFSLHTGDIVPKGRPEEYAFFFTEIKDVKWPFLIAEGNHELGPTGGKLYAELFGPTDYFFDTGGLRFVALDNARGVVTPEQLVWLDKALTTPLRKIVFLHQPPKMIPEWAYHAFGVNAQEMADLFAVRKVERVYVGHIHAFDVADYKGVRYVLTGGAGAGLHEQMAPGNFNHVVLVDVLPTGLRETVYRTDGTKFVLDPAKWIGGQGQ